MGLLTHLRGLWGNLWWLPVTGAAAFLALMGALGNLRPEILVITLLAAGLAVWNRTTRSFLIAAAPGIVIGVGYEVIRYLRPILVTPERVLGCEIRTFERGFASIDGLTLPEYFATRHTDFFDVFFAVPYTAFWIVAVVYALALFFIDRNRMNRYLWLLALVHLVGFVVWMVWPAAPPWYIIQEGCRIDMSVAPNAAGLLRLDQLFGITYFHEFYSRAPTVFGAIPSIHCAFPIAGLLAAWRDVGWGWRLAHIGYAIWMFAASVYLTHHWLVDGLLGMSIVFLAYFLVVRFFPSTARQPAGAPDPAR